jgi:hypothetical protein
MRSLPHPTFLLPLPVWERKEARGKMRGVLRSTSTETVDSCLPVVLLSLSAILPAAWAVALTAIVLIVSCAKRAVSFVLFTLAAFDDA